MALSTCLMMLAASRSLNVCCSEMRSKSSPPLQSLKKLAGQSGHLLCDEEVALVVLEELVELENVGVVHALEDADLRLEFVLLVLFKELLIYDFDGSEGLGLLVETLPYLSIGS